MKLRCMFEGCTRPHDSRGMCKSHYDASRKVSDKPPSTGHGFGNAWRLLRADNEVLRQRLTELEAR